MGAMLLAQFELPGGTYRLRRAIPHDLDALISLLTNDPVRQAENSLDPQDRHRYETAFAAIDGDPHQLLVSVVDEGEEVVATLQLTFIPGLARMGATRLQIEAVRVAPTLQGRGLGTAMLTWAIEEGNRHGAYLVQLTSDNVRVDAHRFYERLGFAASHTGFKLLL